MLCKCLYFILILIYPCTCVVKKYGCGRKVRYLDESSLELQDVTLTFAGIYIANNLKTAIEQKPIPNALEDIEDSLRQVKATDIIDILVRDIHSRVTKQNVCSDLRRSFSDLTLLVDKIDLAYNVYLQYKKANTTTKNRTFYKFLDETRSVYKGPIDLLNSIYTLVVPKDHLIVSSIPHESDGTVLTLLAQNMKTFHELCDKHKSQQQIFHILYVTILTVEAKVLSMLEFCYRKLSEIKEADYKQEMTKLAELFKDRMENTLKFFQIFIKMASREIWRCDPQEHVRDTTYTELEGLFQKFVITEEEINDQEHCSSTCPDHKLGLPGSRCLRDSEHFDFETKYTEHSICYSQRHCKGYIHNCQSYFLDHKELWICPADNKTTHYRYDFMMHGSIDPTFFHRSFVNYGPKGDKSDCPRQISYNKRQLGGYHLYDAFNWCDICLCTCSDSSPNTDRRINTRITVADDGYVITGARLVKLQHTLHVQIKQGKIGPQGFIIPETNHWKDIQHPRVIPYEDEFFDWTELREFYLGVEEIPKGHVLVGLKIEPIHDYTRRILRFKTLSLPYDYETGDLSKIEDHPYYKIYDKHNYLELRDEMFDNYTEFFGNPIPERNKIHVDEMDLQTNSILPATPQPDHKISVNLTTSNFKEDMGQSTIPFFDIQNVVTSPAAPLSGIGFYLKKTDGYGGFIALKLLSYDLSSHVK